VAGSPGYSGYVPSTELPPTTNNSWVTQRVPIGGRRNPSQPTKTQLSPLARSTSPGGPVPVALPPADPSSFFVSKRGQGTLYSDDAARGSSIDAQWQYPKTKAALLADCKRMGPKESTPFTATTLYNNASGSLDTEADKSFFSRIQRAEQQDKAEQETIQPTRPGRASAKEKAPSRTMLKKRMEDPAFAPPKAAFAPQTRRCLVGAEAVAPNEFVQFKGTMANQSSSQIEYGARGSNPNQRMGGTAMELSGKASTNDLLQGTAKATGGARIPGYVGHVPSHPANTGRIRGEGPDVVRQNARNMILMTSGRKTMAGYSGFEPKSIYNDTGKANEPPASLTTAGTAAKEAATGKEGSLNANEHGRTQGVRKFFTQGVGSADHVISDQYFMRYRPMAGTFRMGPRGEQGIPSMHM